MERRSVSSRYSSEGRKLIGYAAVWDSPTEIREAGRTFTEVVRRSAFTRTLDGSGDVLCCFNHDPAKLLGRTASGTLTVTPDEHGLRFEVELPDTATGNEVRTLVERGDLTGASFTFSVRSDKWNGSTRELIDVDLFELGPVAMPAYQQTEIALRSRANWYRKKLELYERS